LPSDRIAQGIDCFQKALPLVTKETGVDFWQEYAFAMNIGNMPFHARWALTRYLQSGGVSLLSQIMDSTLRANLKQADPDIRYSPKALWESSVRHKEVTFTSYPFGLRFTVDSNWRISIGNFDNRKAGVIIKPSIAVSAKGTSNSMPTAEGQGFGISASNAIFLRTKAWRWKTSAGRRRRWVTQAN